MSKDKGEREDLYGGTFALMWQAGENYLSILSVDLIDSEELKWVLEIIWSTSLFYALENNDNE